MNVQDSYYAELRANTEALANELGVSLSCAADVEYLRTRNRHTDALEAELISLHEAGTPPNMCEFGVTAETQNSLMAEAYRVRSSPLAFTEPVQ